MKEVFVQGRTLPEAYHQALLSLEEAPVIPCPDWNTDQKEVSMTFVVTEPLAEPMISRLFFGDPRSLEQYRQEMLDGIMDFEIERGNWVYTYHQRYANQYAFILDELRRNPWSRRAVTRDLARRLSVADEVADDLDADPTEWTCVACVGNAAAGGNLSIPVDTAGHPARFFRVYAADAPVEVGSTYADNEFEAGD